MNKQIQLSKGRELLAMIALIFVGYIVMHDLAFVPIYSNLYQEFSDKPMFAVNLIISGGMIASTVAQLFTPGLLRKFSKKTLLCICGVIYAVTSIGTGWIINVVYMNVMLILCGMAQGVCTVCGAGLITDIYCENEDKKQNMMGIYQALMNVFSIGLSYIAGLLAVHGWTNIFKTYWLAIPVALMFIFFIPNGIKSSEEILGEHEENKSAGRKPLGRKFVLNALSLFFTDFLQIPSVLLISVYISQYKLGDSSFSGLVSSAGTALSFICCMLMGKIISKTKGGSLSLFTVFMMVGGLILMLSHTTAGCLIGSAICAAGYGLVFAYGYILLPSSVPAERINTALVAAGVLGAIVIFLGTNVISPVVMSLGASKAIGISLIFGVVSLVLQTVVRKMNREEAAEKA